MKKLFTVLFTMILLTASIAAAESEAAFSGAGRAILGISYDYDTNEIAVKAVTADDSEVQVEGCTVTELPSGESVRLTATGNWIVLKGAITELYCSGNRLTSLDVRGLQDLTVLECAGNDLTSLDVHGLTALAVLDCSENQLTSLNVQGLSALRELWCSGNELAALDMRGINTVQILGCSGNKLTALELPAVNVLQELYCYGNHLNEKAFIRILTALPDRKQNEAGIVCIYSESVDLQEKNVTDFSSSAELKVAFEAAKAKNWEFYKWDINGRYEKI